MYNIAKQSAWADTRVDATKKITDPRLLVDIILAQLHPRDEVKVAFAALNQIHDSDALLSLIKKLPSAPWREVADFLGQLGAFKRGMLVDMVPQHPDVSFSLTVDWRGANYSPITRSNYQYVQGATVALSVEAGGRPLPLRTFASKMPSGVYSQTSWIAPNPTFNATAVTQEVKKWLAAAR